ncbi:MAG: class I mannose-6-phosphate isomerase [Planctomycetales bacterium]|nr:class I mannose-6-phosphate isomerase [Planctomycetales bacterium]
MSQLPVPYPLRLQPFFQDYLWGGRKLQTVLHKPLPADGVWAESWEIVDHPQHVSIVTNGAFAGESLRHIAHHHRAWLYGHTPALDSLPLLLKYLDCQQVLSVQVHPNDHYAQKMPTPDLGKTEAWYIISAEPNAVLYAGLKSGVTREQLQDAIDNGGVESCLHVLRPQAGDCVFIPAGTVHALGAGLLVAEIQQASNTTFRLFDWNRLSATGQPRELHVQQALEVIDFASGPRQLQTPQPTDQAGRERLVRCDKFILDRLENPPGNQPSLNIGGDHGFHLLTMPRGSGKLQWSSKHSEELQLQAGESLLIPAAMPPLTLTLNDDAVLLDMFVR